jgi:23S rRNA (uracil1939-C5)-methyltransferase
MVEIFMKKNQRNAKNKLRFQKKCPVELGNLYKVDITQTTPNGEGIAKLNNYLIFVDNAKPGDHITVKITNTGPLSAEAKLVK